MDKEEGEDLGGYQEAKECAQIILYAKKYFS